MTQVFGITALLCVLVFYGQAVPIKDKRNGRNGAGISNGHNGVGGLTKDNSTEDHSDQWMSLSEEHRELLLHAYYTAGLTVDMVSCNTTEECPTKFRCDETWKFCVKKDSPHFPITGNISFRYLFRI